MIGWLEGSIVDKPHPGRFVIDVHGVGYDVEVTLPTFFELEDKTANVSLHIHTVVREDALLLYGFLDKQERTLFRGLIKVTGIGPKLAVAILSSIRPDQFMQCIEQQNAAFLIKLPGIGKKTAERLLVEMKGSLQQWQFSEPSLGTLTKKHSEQEEAVHALEALGYKQQEAVKVIKKIDDGQQTCEQLIRKALQALSGCAIS